MITPTDEQVQAWWALAVAAHNDIVHCRYGQCLKHVRELIDAMNPVVVPKPEFPPSEHP